MRQLPAVWNDCGSFGSGQRFSLFWLDLNLLLTLAAVEIVDAEFVVVADAVGESAFNWGLGAFVAILELNDSDCRFQIKMRSD